MYGLNCVFCKYYFGDFFIGGNFLEVGDEFIEILDVVQLILNIEQKEFIVENVDDFYGLLIEN